MSLYKRGGVWWYDFQVNGVRVRESTGLTLRSAAARAEALRKAELIEGRDRAILSGPPPRLAEFAFGDFAAWSENQHREHPSTHERYMRSIKVLVQFSGERTLDTISSADVERFKIVRSHQPRKNAKDGRAVTPAAVNRDLAVLRILFNLAIRLKKARTNPVSGVKLLPEHNLQMRVLSWKEEASYLTAASQPLRDVAMLTLETGMRPGEVFRMKKGDIDLELGFVRVPAGKTPSARRTIPLTGRAREILARRISAAKSEWLFPLPWNPSLPIASVQMTMRYVHPTPEHKKRAIEKFEALSVRNPK
jgi:integrase